MDNAMVIAAILGFAPALFLMYLVLRKYTYPAVESPFFSDPRFFSLFVVGLVAGTLIFVGYTFFYGSWGSLIVAVGFAMVLELVKFVVMNLKRFHGNSDTIFYGYGLGLGIGCTMAFGMIYYISSQLPMDAQTWAVYFMMGLALILSQSAAGTTIGEGVARRRVWEFFFQALVVGLAIQILIASMYILGMSSSLYFVPIVLALIIAAVFFYRVHYIKLPAIVKEILRNESKRPKESKEV